jgi:hypothetical protein
MNYEGIDWVWKYEDIGNRGIVVGAFLAFVAVAIFVGTIVYLFTEYPHYMKVMGSISAAKASMTIV